MAGRIVDVTLRLLDQVTNPLRGITADFVRSGGQWMRAGRQIQAVGQDIQNVGNNLTQKVTLPIVGLGTASVKLAADFEYGMSKVQSVSNATEGEMKALTEKALEMGAKTKFSSKEAADAFSYMAMAGWDVKAMTDGIEGVMYLAGATGEELSQTSDIVTDAMTAFGMGAEETTRFVNVLAQAANKSNTDVAMLGESFKYVAPVAGAMKYNIEDVATALGLMANSGIKASQAGTSLRSWIARMASPTKEVSIAMKKLGISLTDSSGNMKDFQTILTETRKGFEGLSESERTATAAALAGKQGMSGLLAIVNAAEGDFQDLSYAMYNTGDACKDMYDIANNNLMGQLEELSGAVETIGISFGNKLLPYIKEGVTWLQGMAEVVNNLSDEQMDLIIKIAAFAAAAGPMILVIGKMVSGVGTIMTVVGKLGMAINSAGSLGAVIAGAVTGPVGIAIGVVLGLVAAGVLLYKNWDKVKAYALELYEVVKKTFAEMGLTMENLKEKISPLVGKFSELWQKAQPILKKMGEAFSVYFKTGLSAAIGVASGMVSSFFDTITRFVSAIMTTLDGLSIFVSGVFSGDWSMAWEGVSKIFEGVFDSWVTFITTPIRQIRELVKGFVTGIANSMGIDLKMPTWLEKLMNMDFKIKLPKIPKDSFNKLGEYTKKVFEEMGISGEAMKEKFSAFGEKLSLLGENAVELWETSQPIFASAMELMTKLWEKAQPIFTKLGEAFNFCFKTCLYGAVEVASGIFSNFINMITGFVSGIITIFDGIIDFINGVFSGNWSRAWHGITKIVKGAFDALIAPLKYVLNSIISMVNSVISGINSMGFEFPDWVPNWVKEKLGDGVKLNIPKIPALAVGTENWKGGIVQISEKGGEIVDLPSGSRVYPHDKSIQKAYQDGAKGKKNITISIPKIADSVIIRQEADIDLLVNKLADKLEKISQNMGGDDIGYLFTME